jgi:hypothetical protein
VAEIKRQAAMFLAAVFIHVHRSSNGAAHILATTCDVSSSGFVLDFALDCIPKTLYIDIK